MLVEQLAESGGSAVATRRFEVDSSGVCVYSKSDAPLVDPVSQTAVPVFRTVCAYRLRPEATRLLARKMHRRGILGLDSQQGDQRGSDGKSLRLEYEAFGQRQVVIASGQVHGSFVRILHVVNAYLPPGEGFELEGMMGDPVPSNLTGVPAPSEGVRGALAFHEGLLEQHPHRPDLLLHTFALAVAAGKRAEAESLLHRWVEASGIQATVSTPFSDPPRLLPEMLERMLPP
ncbi:MAG: hypothetical protein AB7O97_16980 [Planctomycetota bacterium]